MNKKTILTVIGLVLSVKAMAVEPTDANFLFVCGDPTYQPDFTAVTGDSLWNNKNTITIDDHSMPYIQKIEITQVTHANYSADYNVTADISKSNTCIDYKGAGKTLPELTTCDPSYFVNSGVLNLVIKPIVIFTRNSEEDAGQTVGSFTYSVQQGDLKKSGLMLCDVNFSNLKKLLTP